MAEAQENPNVEEQEEEECPKCPPPGALLGWQHLLIWQLY